MVCRQGVWQLLVEQPFRRAILAGVLAIAPYFGPSAQLIAAEPQIWFGPMQEHWTATTPVTWTYHDFMSMLLLGDSWDKAARSVDVIALSAVHLAEGFDRPDSPTKEALKKTFDRIGTKVAGGGSIVYTDGACGAGGIEGLSNDKGFAREVYYTTKTWHDAGLPMDYFVMDGPYYFAYIYVRDKCHFTIEDVAARAATTIGMIRDLYPNIKLIDAEGPGAELPAQWLPGYNRFLDAFAAAYGAPIDTLDMDLHWTDTWHTGYRWTTAATEIANAMHARNMKVSLVMNADDSAWDPDVPPADPKADPRTAMTVEYWMAAVRKHIDLVKQNNIPLDAVNLESWMRFPRYNLPETDPTAWTSVVNYAHDVLAPGR